MNTRVTDIKARIAYLDAQIMQKQLWAQYWIAMATTGSASFLKTERGREPTPEEKAQGQIIGWTPLTNEQKISDALETALTHIHHISDFAGARDKLIRELGDIA